jgi:hypothetical protein
MQDTSKIYAWNKTNKSTELNHFKLCPKTKVVCLYLKYNLPDKPKTKLVCSWYTSGDSHSGILHICAKQGLLILWISYVPCGFACKHFYDSWHVDVVDYRFPVGPSCPLIYFLKQFITVDKTMEMYPAAKDKTCLNKASLHLHISREMLDI